ncbi:MAG: hypothetical protein IJW64_05795 [Clostridia bacterium]|nr:hypothetical protein [Clostridia bacterium]
MDVNIIKGKGEVIAFTIFPIGVVGWGSSENQAIIDLNDNLYDFCNWLLWKLPKEPTATVKGRYSGEVGDISFKEDDKKLFKKYAEVVLQTAFSFKSMIDSVSFSNEDLLKVEKVFKDLGFTNGEGILECSATVSESEDFCLARAFIYKVYRLAKELFFDLKNRGEQVFDAFKFAV